MARPRLRRGLAAEHLLDRGRRSPCGRAFVAGLGVAELREQRLLLLATAGSAFRPGCGRPVSPRPRPLSTLMPEPRWRSCSPDWRPAGILISTGSPSIPGSSIDPPSAAVVKLIGHSATRVVPSRAIDRVPLHVDEQIEVAAGGAANARLAFAGNADARAFVDPGGDVDRQLALARARGPRRRRCGTDR